jgi:hypothetical protein
MLLRSYLTAGDMIVGIGPIRVEGATLATVLATVRQAFIDPASRRRP